MKFGVVLVTFNRLNMLKKALELYKNQSRKPDMIIIVDNASTDGTKEYIQEWRKENNNLNVVIKDLPMNMGGSGGFHEGLAESLKHPLDWIWVADDDAFPELNAFEQFDLFIKRFPAEELNQISVVAGMVINHDKIDLLHRRRLHCKFGKIKEIDVEEAEYKMDFFEFDLISYVGAIIKREALQKVGLTEKDYFIWFDDVEHSVRLRQHGKIYCVPAIKIQHDQTITFREITWKRYYGLRNKLLMVKKHFSFFAYMRLCLSYLRKSLTKSRKEDRKIFFAALCDGVKDKKGLHDIYRPGWKIIK